MARLLIVEDHPELASLMVAAAESRGHEAQAVHTGEAALALLRPGAFHAAVVDLLLPDMRGSAVLSALKDHAIPAVAVSGVFKGDRFAREATEVHGARAFFEKPFELLQLLDSVEQLCGLTRPVMPPPPPEDDDVVVFEDAALLDMEDEPLFDSGQDEPLFTAPPEELTPVIQGLALVEEPSEPEEIITPEPEPEPEPAPQVATPISQEVTVSSTLALDEPVLEALTPSTLHLDAAALDALSPPHEESPAPVAAPAQVEHAPSPSHVDAEELKALEALEPVADAPSAEPPPASAPTGDVTTLRVKTLDLEEIDALEALNPVEEPPAPPPEVTAESSASTPSEPQAEASPELVIPLQAEAPAEPVSEPQAEPTAVPEPGTAEPGIAEPEPGLALPFGEREKVWSKTAAPGPRNRVPPEWSLSGDLKNTSIPRLLNAYYEARHSGELKLRQGSILKVIYFEAGRPVYAASNVAQERFARICVRRGVLPEARLQEVLTLTREQNIRTSEALTRLGLLDAQKRRQLTEEQVKEILWSTFSWTEGAYGFSPLRPPRAGLVKLSVFPGDLILEGIARTEPLVTLRQRMPRTRRLFPSAAPAYGLHELKLQGQQALLLAYADGSKTVEDLLAVTELPERDVLATLRGLELIGVLEERREEPRSPRSRISFGL